MRCSPCHTENKAGRKFCAACGQALALACPACGFVNDPGDRFCGGCGQALTAMAPPELRRPPSTTRPEDQPAMPATSSPIAPHPPDAERRHLTVMFCDLVDSTPLSEQLDPEDLREVVRAYQQTCAEVIQRFEGNIAQYLGDGLLVYFGYPQAHDNDAQRAVQASLSILSAMETLNARLARDKNLRLAVRVGIHTGLVVVGEMGGGGRHEQLALGDTPNLAARIQGLAAPDTVLISAATHRLVQGYFTTAALDPQVLKGVAAPVSVYRILETSAAQSRLDVAAATGLTPLVGRESEVALLLERWEQSQSELGQVVLLHGEGGIGKSRLVEVLRQRVVGEGSPCIVLRCSPYHTNSALYPVIDHLQRVLRFKRDDTPEERLRKLEDTLLGTPSPPMGEREKILEVVPLLAALLSVPLPEGRYPPLLLSPEQQRQQTLDALVSWLLAGAERQPVLAVWEDLHWTDPSTLELLSLVIEQAPMARLLTLVTARPEFHPPWASRSHLTQLTLGRLPHPQVEAMVRQLTGGKPLPAELLAQVVARTDGVPLFVEELVKMLLESGLVWEEADRYALTGPLPPLAIPATLQDSLMARLDRLSNARAVAQLGAVLGREFDYELIQAMAPMDEATVQRGLVQLVDAELLYQRGRPPQARYLFKHALIQEAAYQSLLKNTRQQYHQRTAQVLAASFPEVVETQPELLAHHYTEAGRTEQAIAYWQRAGERAVGRSAHVEAIGHFRTALEVLGLLPDTPARVRQELTLQRALGAALLATQGFAAPDVEHAYTRARALCQRLGDTPEIFPVLFGLWGVYETGGDLRTARELGAQLLTLAQRQHDPALLLQAHRTLGDTLFYLGEFGPARAHLEQGIALYNSQQHRDHAVLYGQDPGMGCRIFAALTLWVLGYPDQALHWSHEALTLAHELSHPFSLTYALARAARLHGFRGEWQAAQEWTEALMALARAQGFAQALAAGQIQWGCTLAAQGQGQEGITHMRQGLDASRATGAELPRPFYLTLLAEAYGREGQPEEGLGVLAEAMAAAPTIGERWYEAERHRLKGELLLKQTIPDAHQAEACFQQALAVARHQQAKSWELRAATSLSRLWQRQSKHQEAHDLLAPIYVWFTEGFDTADLQEAKALLDAFA